MPFSEAHANHAINFIEQLKLTKGKWAGQPFKLLPWEKDLVRRLFGTLREDGTRQYRTAYVEIGKKNGKALSIDTPIPTPSGWTTMKNLKVGDEVFDENGKTCRVLGATEIMYDRPCYEVKFSDGESIIADGEHLWKLKDFETPFTTVEIEERLKAGAENFIDHRRVTAVKSTASIPVKCIEVSSKSRLYLAGKSMVPTHNSELGAAIALYMLCADGEPNAEVYVAACDRQQASIIFNTSMNFVEGNRTLSKVTNLVRSTKRITYPKTGSFYQVLSSDVKSKSGINASCVILDEIWTYPNPDLAKMLTTGSGDARTQPLFLYLTTAGNKLSGYGWEMHQKAKDILDGKRVDPTFLSIIYGLEDDADISDENNWYKANPSLGHTIQIERVREHYNQVKDDPADLALFKQLRLNMWLKQEIKWMPMDKWDLCNYPVDLEELKGRVCYGGLDLSSTTDITAFVLVFPPEDEEDKYQILPFFWLPEETLHQRVKKDAVPYDIWHRQGLLNLTEGNVVHYGFIEKFIERLGEKYNIREIVYDRWGATQMSQNLEGMGFTVVPFGQGFKDMSPPTKDLMRLTLSGQIAHGGHPVLRWMADNIVVRTDPAGNIKVDKEKSSEKIDGIVALIMALARAQFNPSGDDSVYDERDLIIFG
ncbi:phage terminase large subunit-like protein [Desulfitispora alkaliphila]|uniref:terminase TerL endonuclease subunit n=1 Tax=Desulfitispora alkaliphila TaxID=622674 RepID=UPI003D1C4807